MLVNGCLIHLAYLKMNKSYNRIWHFLGSTVFLNKFIFADNVLIETNKNTEKTIAKMKYGTLNLTIT